jgi:hypothetical protein
MTFTSTMPSYDIMHRHYDSSPLLLLFYLFSHSQIGFSCTSTGKSHRNIIRLLYFQDKSRTVTFCVSYRAAFCIVWRIDWNCNFKLLLHIHLYIRVQCWWTRGVPNAMQGQFMDSHSYNNCVWNVRTSLDYVKLIANRQ